MVLVSGAMCHAVALRFWVWASGSAPLVCTSQFWITSVSPVDATLAKGKKALLSGVAGSLLSPCLTQGFRGEGREAQVFAEHAHTNAQAFCRFLAANNLGGSRLVLSRVILYPK